MLGTLTDIDLLVVLQEGGNLPWKSR